MGADRDPQESVDRGVRRLRHARKMAPAALGAPEFSAAFVRAVEAGRYDPSPLAREILARRLAVPVADLAALPASRRRGPDPEALGEDILCQIEHVRPLLYTWPEAFLRELDNLAATYQARFAYLPVLPRYRYHYLRGNAHVRARQLDAAQQELDTALALAEQLPGGAQEVERVRNAIGAVYYVRDQPARALEYHSRCLRAVYAGVVKDLTLALVIFTSVANDCWALNEVAQAVGIYHEALARLADVDLHEQRAEIYGGLGAAYLVLGDLNRAKVYTGQSLGLHEQDGHPPGIGRQATNLAEIMIARGEYEGVEALLARARPLVETPGNESPLIITHVCYALLALHRADLAAADAAAQEALRLSAGVLAAQDPAGGPRAVGYALRTHARALAVAAQVAEGHGDPARADSLFEQALDAGARSEYAETLWEIARTYADLLHDRGDAERAVHYYRLAWSRMARPGPSWPVGIAGLISAPAPRQPGAAAKSLPTN